MNTTVKTWAQSTRTKRIYQKHNKIVPPTCTTFNNFGTIRNKVGNVAGFSDERFISTAHKKPFATFGLPKGKLL